MIEIYGTTWCGPCRYAKQLCEENFIQYHMYDVDENPDKLRELRNRVDISISTLYPIVFVNGVHLSGGLSALKKIIEENEVHKRP